ncbi:hypothetical protein [Candidatus Blastococcus massiliensis]|uniref:hypothetical protein n=1 Tax=Candidatus Blastococcus massiliensis TaxID=1470358 RepID=UPI0004B8474F|nr:hypothetical protein [Candidatus Blastococcus massiliensis]
MNRSRRLPATVLAFLVGASLVPGMTATATAAPSVALPADSVRLVAQFPATLAGAGFQVTRDAGTRTQAASETLRSGALPPSGLLSVTLPKVDLPADNGVAFLQAIAVLPIPGTDTALQSVASVGITDHTLTETSVVTLTVPVPKVVPTYTPKEVHALTGGGGRTGEEPPDETEIARMQQETEAQPVAVPDQGQVVLPARAGTEGGEAAPARNEPEYGDPAPEEGVGEDGGALENRLEGPATPSRPAQNGPDVPLSTPPLRTVSYTNDQVTDAQDIYGVYTFRSWSTQGYGMRAQFKMSATAETVTQNGWRSEAGAFEVNGSMSVSKQSSNSSTTADTWPMRSDCWRSETGVVPSVQGDGPDCTNIFYGFIGAYGNDTWRWERHVSTTCFEAFICSQTVYETVRNRWYIGGTFSDDFIGLTNYEKRPSAVRSGSFGNWTGLDPGSTRQSDFNASFTRTRGATVSVKATWGSAFGSVTFESTTSQRNESLASMTYEVRRLVRNGETQNFMYKYWYYDHDGRRRYDHFSCELNPGWVSTGACWNNGS